jgi:hydroxypyruvate isomerase
MAVHANHRTHDMPKFAANLTMLWNELDFMDRFAAAAKAEFTGVEYLFPYDYDKNRLANELRKHKLTQVLYNLPAGNWAKGERGIGYQRWIGCEYKPKTTTDAGLGWVKPYL